MIFPPSHVCIIVTAAVDPGISKQGGGPDAVEFLGAGNCFDALSHILYVFLVKVDNKIHIVNITC